jgi:hypothetical protein
VNTRLFSAFSQASKRPLATRITVIDSVIEPIKVLKILLEGITPTDETGIWITRFSGLPVARSFSPFDLVYLDDDFRVVHTAEITQNSNFVPFKGLPTSALVLPPDSIVLSKTHAGDRLAMYAYDPAASSAQPRQVIPPAKQAAKPSAPPAPASSAPRVHVTPERVHVAAPVATTLQGEVLRPAKPAQSLPVTSQSHPAVAVPQISESPEPLAPPQLISQRSERSAASPVSVEEKRPSPVAETTSQPAPAPAVIASAEPASIISLQEVAASTPPATNQVLTAASPQSSAAAPTPPAPLAPEITLAVPIPVEQVAETPAPIAFVPEVPPCVASIEAPVEAHASAPGDAPEEAQRVARAESDQSPELAKAETSSAALPPEAHTGFTMQPWFSEPGAKDALAAESASESPESEGPEGDEQDESPQFDIQRPQDHLNLARRWDVKLLYALFPELHPSFRPELQMPSVDPLKYMQSQEENGRISTKLQLLSWLYPDLELETLQKRQREQRRAPRVPNPGLVGYFYNSGKAEPHEISNFSVTGFYMKTDERFLPGTVIRVTLQVAGTDGTNPGDSLTLHSRVVNWDEQGGGFEFVLPGFLD